LQKPTAGARRHAHDVRPDRPPATTVARINRLSVRAERAVQARLRGRRAPSARSLSAALARTLHPFASAERVLPIAVATIVAVASLLAVLPSTPQGAVGGVQGTADRVRIAVGGAPGRGVDRTAADSLSVTALADGAQERDIAVDEARLEANFRPLKLPADVANEPAVALAAVEPAPVLDDGTLLTGYAPDTTVEDGADLIHSYKVKRGDTLVTIARKFDVSMMTLWWANKLKSKTDLHVGQVLRIPPVSGLVHVVKDTDTLETVAAKFKVDAQRIIELNGLDDPTLVVGQVLVLPGAKGDPIPTPKPKAIAKPKPARAKVAGGGPARYTGGAFRWPVVGGGNYISQHFHYGHYGLDIAADYGSRVVAAAGGKVIFAGWKSNGGGYQVWISHGSGMYTTYNHMAGVSVRRGQSVGRGQQVGRVGMSGWATGPHLHFEVWRGPVWNGGNRVNPLGYL
jgi:murein DD-endopeptidase MepM/ murein hydrolase activator NlpD